MQIDSLERDRRRLGWLWTLSRAKTRRHSVFREYVISSTCFLSESHVLMHVCLIIDRPRGRLGSGQYNHIDCFPI